LIWRIINSQPINFFAIIIVIEKQSTKANDAWGVFERIGKETK